MPRVLITDYVHNDLITGLEKMGYDCTYNKNISYREVLDQLPEYEGVVINSKVKMTKSAMDKAKQLQWIARLGSGLDIIDLPYAAQNNISVYSAPEGNRNAVAEHVVGMLLSLNNQLIRANQEVKTLQWNREARRGVEVMGKTIGILGFGNTGSALATKLIGFGCKILAYDKYKLILDPAYYHVDLVSLEELQEQSDIISVHLPLTEETRYLIADNFLTKCKDGVILINTSRGKVVHIPDLLASLESNKVKGACLDVFPNEKVDTFKEEDFAAFEKIAKMDNVLVSPHVAGWTHESLQRIAHILLLKIGSQNV